LGEGKNIVLVGNGIRNLLFNSIELLELISLILPEPIYLFSTDSSVNWHI
jgi:hypothetical protein